MELQLMDAAWYDTGNTHVFVLVASGGVGKSALVKRWLAGLKKDKWRGAQRVYGWGFYSQGTKEERQASEDVFLEAALDWFGIVREPSISPWDKGRLLAEAFSRDRTLLILDGIEPLQHPPGPLGGQLRAPGLQTLLCQLAAAGHPGLCVVTTRESIKDLEEYQGDHHSHSGVMSHSLESLDDADGAQLLHHLGVRRAGNSAITSNDPELLQASLEVQGHALTLRLLGGYLVLARGGDIRERSTVNLAEADMEFGSDFDDREKPYGRAFKTIAAYEEWFGSGGSDGSRELAVLRLLGLFAGPAQAGCLQALRNPPAIVGLTEPLVGLTEPQWRLTLNRLAECGLISCPPTKVARSVDPRERSLDSHPLIREYFAAKLHDTNLAAWTEAQQRLYEYLRDTTPHLPDSLDDLLQLCHAVVHGCRAGRYQEALDNVFWERIRRGTIGYIWKRFGAFSADSVALSSFFETAWIKPALQLSAEDRAFVLHEAGFVLQASGQLQEAQEPLRTALEMRILAGDNLEAAKSAANLSTICLTLGDLEAAKGYARQTMQLAESEKDKYQWEVGRASLAFALNQAGTLSVAEALYGASDSPGTGSSPEYPDINSLNLVYCDLLKAPKAFGEMQRRASKALKWATEEGWLLQIAWSNLSLAQALAGTARTLDDKEVAEAKRYLDQAVQAFRDSGQRDELPRGLLLRAEFSASHGDTAGADRDLLEAEGVARRGGMKLYDADIHLLRARLHFRRASDKSDPADRATELGLAGEHTLAAESLVNQIGYHRRLPDVLALRRDLGMK
jgi:tetratricopeptide (TPR) repeat protein